MAHARPPAVGSRSRRTLASVRRRTRDPPCTSRRAPRRSRGSARRTGSGSVSATGSHPHVAVFHCAKTLVHTSRRVVCHRASPGTFSPHLSNTFTILNDTPHLHSGLTRSVLPRHLLARPTGAGNGSSSLPLRPKKSRPCEFWPARDLTGDRKSTRLNSSHANISY